MYTGKNPKALLSIKLITAGFRDELQRKPYDQISIRDLCKASDISRQTFYNVFEGKEEVLRRCIRNIFDSIMKRRSESGKPSARQSIEAFVQAFYENRAFMNQLIRDHLENIFAQEFIHAIFNLSEMGTYVPKKHLDYHLCFYAGWLTSVLIQWMQNADAMTSEELIDLLANDFRLPYFSN